MSGGRRIHYYKNEFYFTETDRDRDRDREREREMALERDSFFHVLRSKSTNKMCFDCNSRNPDWASVQHGVIICIGAYALDSNHSLVDVCMRVSFRERMRVCVCVCVFSWTRV